MITTFYPPYGFGGDAIYVQRLGMALQRYGHHVEIIHCIDSFHALDRTRRPESREKVQQGGYIEKRGNLIVHRLKSWAGALSPLATYLTGQPHFKRRKIERILRNGRFDVIHYHNISLIGGPGVLALGQAIKLYTMHEHWLLCPTHVLFRFNRELCTRRTCKLCQLSYRVPIQPWRQTSLLKKSLNHVDAFLALTRFTRDLHQKQFAGLPWKHLPPFAAAIEEQDENPALEWLPKGPFALYVGRLERLKGVQTLLPLFERSDGSGPAMDLVIVGEGRLAALVRTAVRRESSRIHCPGHLPTSQLPAIYARALAVIVPSLTYEVFNQVIVEAFASGTPVIARDLGPLGEIVKEAGGGVLYRDEHELTDHLQMLLNHPDQREQLGRAGRQAIERLWSEDAVMDRYLGMIGELRQQTATARARIKPS